MTARGIYGWTRPEGYDKSRYRAARQIARHEEPTLMMLWSPRLGPWMSSGWTELHGVPLLPVILLLALIGGILVTIGAIVLLNTSPDKSGRRSGGRHR